MSVADSTTEAGPGLFLEDFTTGDVFETGSRTITAEDITVFADVTGDQNPLHTDPQFAATTPFGEVIAHGLLGLGVLTGLFEDLGIFRGTALAFLGISDWSFRRPILAGDTVRARMTVLDVRRSRSDSGRGILTRRYELLGADGGVVQDGTTTVLLRARSTGPQPPGPVA